MTGSRDKMNLLFHTRVLGRSDQEAMIRNYCSSLDAAWEGAVALALRKSEEIRSIDGGPLIEPAAHVWMIPGDKVSASIDFNDCGCAGWHHPADNNSYVECHPAEALVLACLRAVGVSEEELK